MVASDRISTYDVVHPNPIPDKGKVLTGLTGVLVRPDRGDRAQPPRSPTPTCPRRSAAAAMLVEKLEMVPVECVVRGYITGSGWKDYQATGEICGIALPEGLQESEQLPEPIFTPATKAEVGDHDENVDFDRAAEILGDRAAAGGAAPALDRALHASAPRTRASAGSSWPTPSSSSAAAPTARSCWATRCSPPTRRASGRPTATSPATASPRSTSSTCATGPRSRAGTRPRPRRALPDDVVDGHRASVRGGLRADHRRAVRRPGSSAAARR